MSHRRFTIVLAASIAMSAQFVHADAEKIPSPADCDVPCGIVLVGSNGGVADPRGQCTVVVRTLSHNPLPGCSVVLDFSQCGSDVRVGSVQMTAGSGGVCDGGRIYAVTDMSGTATLRFEGSIDRTAAGSPWGCAQLYGDGVFLGALNVSAFDENGFGGVNPVDMSEWLTDSFAPEGANVARSDFDCSHSVAPPDLSMMLEVSLAGASTTSCTSYCR